MNPVVLVALNPPEATIGEGGHSKARRCASDAHSRTLGPRLAVARWRAFRFLGSLGSGHGTSPLGVEPDDSDECPPVREPKQRLPVLHVYRTVGRRLDHGRIVHLSLRPGDCGSPTINDLGAAIAFSLAPLSRQRLFRHRVQLAPNLRVPVVAGDTGMRQDRVYEGLGAGREGHG